MASARDYGGIFESHVIRLCKYHPGDSLRLRRKYQVPFGNQRFELVKRWRLAVANGDALSTACP
jgi:hypothetical protein